VPAGAVHGAGGGEQPAAPVPHAGAHRAAHLAAPVHPGGAGRVRGDPGDPVLLHLLLPRGLPPPHPWTLRVPILGLARATIRTRTSRRCCLYSPTSPPIAISVFPWPLLPSYIPSVEE